MTFCTPRLQPLQSEMSDTLVDKYIQFLYRFELLLVHAPLFSNPAKAALPTFCSYLPILDVHRRSILLVAAHDVPHRREQRDPAEHGDVPIHRRRVHRCGDGEEAEDEEGAEEA